MTNRYWLLITVFLVAVTATGGVLALSRYSPGEEISISSPSPPGAIGQILLTGEVTSPGLYPLMAGDTIRDILGAAGGTIPGADTAIFELRVRGAAESTAQRIDINRAESWLLQALPGIGEVKASAIIAYREQNGPFVSTHELVSVSGIGDAIYEKIKDFITAGD